MPIARLLIPALAALALAGAAAAQALYSPPEGDFAVAFAQAPHVAAKPANRSKDIAVRRYVDQGQSRALIVSIEDFPDGDLPAAADGGVYDRMLRNYADNNDGQLVSTKPARLAGRPCLEGQIVEHAAGTTDIIRVLLIGDRLYQLTYAMPEGADPRGADAAFFNSFRILKP
jgi:hypothetical protein